MVRIVGRALDQSVHGAADPQQLAQLVVDASLEKVCRDHMLTQAELDAVSTQTICLRLCVYRSFLTDDCLLL